MNQIMSLYMASVDILTGKLIKICCLLAVPASANGPCSLCDTEYERGRGRRDEDFNGDKFPFNGTLRTVLCHAR